MHLEGFEAWFNVSKCSLRVIVTKLGGRNDAYISGHDKSEYTASSQGWSGFVILNNRLEKGQYQLQFFFVGIIIDVSLLQQLPKTFFFHWRRGATWSLRMTARACRINQLQSQGYDILAYSLTYCILGKITCDQHCIHYFYFWLS